MPVGLTAKYSGACVRGGYGIDLISAFAPISSRTQITRIARVFGAE